MKPSVHFSHTGVIEMSLKSMPERRNREISPHAVHLTGVQTYSTELDQYSYKSCLSKSFLIENSRAGLQEAGTDEKKSGVLLISDNDGFFFFIMYILLVLSMIAFHTASSPGVQ